jgi:putative transposase
MARPSRNADPKGVLSPKRTFFNTTKTIMGQNLLQSERNATLFIDVLRFYVAAKKFVIHDFVVMPNHVHLLMSVDTDMSIERAMQFIKGGYSYSLKKELGYLGEIWQLGFSDVRVKDRASFLAYREYIYQNPFKAGLVDTPEKFPYCSLYLKQQKAAGAKAR